MNAGQGPPPNPIDIATKAQEDRHKEAVVQIVEQRKKGGSGRRGGIETTFHGSGFIIGKNLNKRTLMVITCEHVITIIPGASTNRGSLKVRLYGSNVNLDATLLFKDKPMDLAVLSVVVENINHCPVVSFSSAIDKAHGTIVVLVGNFHPAGALLRELNEPKLLPLMPSGYGGVIVGPPIDKGREGIMINHNCHGLRGTSGSPLICHDTSNAIGVYLGSRNQIDEAAATETVNMFLQLWLNKEQVTVNENDDINITIARCLNHL